jgi:hypothetical protein
MNDPILAESVSQYPNPGKRYFLHQCEECRCTLVSDSSPPEAHLCRDRKNHRFFSEGQMKLLASGELESLLQWQTSVAQGVDSDFKGV